MPIKKISVSHKGRKCKYPKCRKLLSIYNHADYCYVHLGKMVDKEDAEASGVGVFEEKP